MHASRSDIIAGIFVGGRSTRMGGRPKGLLELTPGQTLVQRWQELFDAQGIPCLLVGESAAYSELGLQALPDTAEHGPLGGLLALLAHAGDRLALAVACDMPFVSATLVARLVSAPPAPAVAARRGGRWEPFFARYDAPRVLPRAEANAREGRLSLQALLDTLPADELTLSPAEAAELDDWDTPEDTARPR